LAKIGNTENISFRGL